MSNLTVKGNASGTGTVILEAPNTNTNRTITLPDATATLATTADSITQTQLETALNASGSAPIYAARAWVNFNGTGTVSIRASGNVSSITDNGVGDYTINFTTALPDVNYATLAGGGNTASTVEPAVFAGVTRAVGTCRIRVSNASGSAIDRSEINIAIFR